MTTLERSFADAPALPFAPHVTGSPDALPEILAGRSGRANSKRRRYPSLATATVCLLTCASALFATSPQGEEQLTAWVPSIRKTVHGARTAMLASNPDRAQASFDLREFR